MAAEMSLVSVVLFIATGALVFFLLFLFAKRQIMRFALRSARKPHINIGADAPRELREEIQRRLTIVQSVRFEPTLLSEQVLEASKSVPNHYLHRMKALDAFTNAVDCLRSKDTTIGLRGTKQTMQLYLFTLCPSAANSSQAQIIDMFCSSYNHARHHPANFGNAELTNYMELLDKVIRMIKDNKKRRAAALYPAVETEVRLRRDCGKRESAETVRHTGKSNNLRLQARRNQPAASRPEHVEQFNMVDKSSGYSSTDHSSSGRGSVERLISPQHSFKPERDEAV
ncbi:hypothetical protein C0Q70_20387 [Pomacea canaliculata]|uniref:Uncharacterized protein n=1 Tax=Pomacea canaliculata TaxID=400727 RepID=A0A2T7NFD6_POMCA|nr:uncharacterized protein C1orf43 homolog [Pomacea canaliculata]PVD19893.1 hypothetical protein C0Q70_20387 [Pomacea canaliculata]